ncbi:CRTAC1 family protein [Deminuibacter soli]|uniref:CRTAC1 family protein n=2 Tax=Deminuibacter soli TaxID=2291815 RepID=A0A3E1NDS7_9BACT|nr:CRTAC1 family protein [Deminuibacter soli]
MNNTGIAFNNEVTDGKLENGFTFRNFYNGGGVAIGDINNDGLADVFFTSNMGNNKLFLNKGNWQFEDISDKAGLKQDSMWSTGVVFADINNDGWLDIYVCNSGHMKDGNRRNKLYINHHNNTFTDSAAAYGLDIKAYTTQVSFFDYDMDGDLDCFMINNSPIPINTLGYANRRDLPEHEWPVANFLKGGGDHLWRNDNGHFTEVTKQAGIHGSLMSFGLGVSVGDINNDGYPDVFVSNDSYERDYLYINQKNGTFKDEFEQCMQHASFSSMGADVADINNDGWPDIFTTDMLPEEDFRLKTLGSFDNIDLYRSKLKAGFYHQFMKNCLQLNSPEGKFADIANYSGVAATDWSWGALLFDADNDGFNDIYVCNGVNRDVTNLDFMDFFASDIIQKMVLTGEKQNVDEVLKNIPRTPMVSKAYRNMGDLRFKDEGSAWGVTKASFSNGAAYGDLDNDGDLDLVINNENAPSFVYRNNARELNKNHYLGFVLKGNAPNTFAIGSKIKLYAGGQLLTRELVPSRGFQSSMDYKQLIGLGNTNRVDSVEIIWPNLTHTVLQHAPIDTVLVVQQSTASAMPPALSAKKEAALLQEVKTSFDKHKEDDYIDFYYERDIPAMLSREGPRAAAGDINGDGLEDIFIGGAAGQGGQLYLQNAAGAFVKKETPAFKLYADFEDVATLLFDCDHDGDLDLLVCPGGNEASFTDRQFQLRLFKNDGKGNFTIDTQAFPSSDANIGVAAANDIDGDGDLDLFIGARSVPVTYGASPESNIYINDGNGHFSVMAAAKPLQRLGMVTGAVWADVAGDKNKELIVAGEWMAPHVFAFANGTVTELHTGMENLFGMWQTVAAGDVNGDGKQDLLLGNIGPNFCLRPDSAHPAKLWLGDFDGNGSTDKIVTRTVNGKDMPFFLKQDMQDQMPSIKKQNLKHSAYAQKTAQDLLGKQAEKALVKQFNYGYSCIAVNQGNGTFSIQLMPAAVQLSSVNAIVCKDINGDGYADMVTGGNLSSLLPQFERLDASFGNVLLNDGKGNFRNLPVSRSGLQVMGVVKDILPVNSKSGQGLLFLRNDDYPVLYRYAAAAIATH